MLFIKHNYLVIVKLGLFFTLLLTTSCKPNTISPDHVNGVREVKVASEEPIADPLWDPTGRLVVINSYLAPMSRIYLFDFESGKLVLLYEAGGSAVAEAWTPDGKWITSFIDTAHYEEGIWNIDPSNKEPPIFVTTGHDASWSPDGSQLAVWDHSPWVPSGENTERLRIIDMQSKEEDTPFKVKGKDISATGLSWSTNGEYIAFSLNVDHQGGQIYVLDVKTKIATKITNDKDDHWSPSWAPNNQLISYVSRSTNFDNSIVVSTADGKCKAPVPGITDVWSVAWSPTGKQLLFGWRNARIYLIDLDTIFERDILTEGIICS